MNNYLLTLVLNPDQAETSRKGLLDLVTKKVLGTEGKMHKEDLWGSRDLAYPIKKQTKAFYAHFEFTTDPKIAKDLDKTLRVEEDILRYLLVKVEGDFPKPPVKVAPKVVQAEKVEVTEEAPAGVPTEAPVKKMIRKRKTDGK